MGQVKDGRKASVLGRAREKDNFLALLLNKSVSIATVQPAAGVRERERKRGEIGGERQRERKGGREGESYHSNGGRGRKKTWRNFKKCKRQDKQRQKEFTGRQ